MVSWKSADASIADATLDNYVVDGQIEPGLRDALEEMDRMIGELRDAIRAEDPRTAVCIVSDHGFAPVTSVLYLDAALVKAGLIALKGQGTTVEAAGLADWIARSWPARTILLATSTRRSRQRRTCSATCAPTPRRCSATCT